MSGPVAAALLNDPLLGARYAAFRDATHGALDPALVALVEAAVARAHGQSLTADDKVRLDRASGVDRLCADYAARIPFEHTAITDAEAAAVRDALGEPGYIAFSVVAALADAECRAAKVGLAGLAR